MIEITGNRILIAWLAICAMNGVGWLLGRMAMGLPSRMITAPPWVLLLCGVKPGNKIDHKMIGLQLFFRFLLIWATVLAILVSDFDRWNTLFGIGLCLALIGLFLFKAIKSLVLSKHSRD